MPDTTVSILIPCFNAQAWVGEAIESALAQSWPHKEIIVVDDGSTDGSLAVIQGFGDRIRFETGPNRGGGTVRNRLLEMAGGDWIQYLDADDMLLPDKIIRQMEIVRQHPNADIICNPVFEEKRVGGEIVRLKTAFPDWRDPWAMLALWELPQTGGPLWKRAALERVDGWRPDQPCCQEHELYERLLEVGSCFVFAEDCLAVYRVWDIGDRLVPRLAGEIPRQRLMILDRMEAFLARQRALDAPRRQAINDARHQLGRGMWQRDRAAALDISARIRRSDARFVPSANSFAPSFYRLTFRLLGFRGAEIIADSRRLWTRRRKIAADVS